VLKAVNRFDFREKHQNCLQRDSNPVPLAAVHETIIAIC